MIKKINYKFILLLMALCVILIPNTSNAAKISVNQVKNLKVTETSQTAVKLKWSKVKNIKGYKIYIYNANKNAYKYYTSTSTNSIKISNLKSAQSYKIKVRAYTISKGKTYYGKYSSIMEAVTLPEITKNVQMKSTTENSIKVTWSKVSRATGYKVYIIDEKTNTYKYYGTTNTNLIKIKNLKSAKTYKIRVRAYVKVSGKKYYGGYSSKTKITTRPQKTNNVKLSENTLDSITISWDKVTRAAGYRVYRYNTTSKKWNYYGETTSRNMKISKLEAGTQYIFKVRAFINFNNTKYYGEFSDEYKASTKNKIRQGIDVSKWQGEIDWKKVKDSGIEVAIIRAGNRGSEIGQIREDEYFKTNVQQATSLGLDVGIYFYSYAISTEEAKEEANWCISKLKEYGVEDKCKYIAFDFEVYNSGRAENVVTKDILNENAIAFLNEVNKNGYTPILYGNRTYLSTYFDTNKIVSAVSKCKIWLAEYKEEPQYQGKYDIWQYTKTGTNDGIYGDVDLNIVYF